MTLSRNLSTLGQAVSASGNIPSANVSGLATVATSGSASDLGSGTLPVARLSGSYTGITGVGTLAAGSIPSSLITGLTAAGQFQNVMALYPTTVINSTGTPLVNTGTGTFNFTCPTGVTKVRATVIAGGGGGGDDGCTGGQSGGYGGVGVGVYTVVPGTVYSVTVGNGGAGSSRPGNGSAGGSSSFYTFLTTTGGGGGSSAGAGQGSSGGATGATLKNTNSGSFSFTGSSFGTTVSGAGTKSWGISTSYAPGSGAGQYGGTGGVSGVVFLEYVG
jgi:hypothetical protein